MTAAATTLVVASCGFWTGNAHADPPPPPPEPKTVIDHDGTFAVGTDIVAGNYSTPGPVADGTCYWKRVSSDDETLDNALTKKSQIVSILPTDKAFKTNGCQPWQITDAAPPPPASPGAAALQLGGLINTIINGAGQRPPPP